jgi:cobalamin biosynthesis Mg chelatase CobN
MIGTHGRPARISGPLFLSLSVSALLALALFPVLVQADSSGIQYSDAPPTATGKEPVPHEANEPPAKSSKSPNGGASAPSKNGSSESNSSEGGSSAGGSTSSGSDGGGSSGPTATGNNGGGAGQQSSPDKASSGAPTNGLQTSGQASSKPASTQSDSGGSSPLIPILIAIAVLALISFGAMMFKQRRQRGASSSRVSPKAS